MYEILIAGETMSNGVAHAFYHKNRVVYRNCAMLYRVSRILLYLLTILYYSSTHGETLLPKENDKLSPSAALQMCFDSFDIHKDKIIRAQDSQGMGAKYLNEVDLDSRQECLRLCCGTDECDVFIFEEKKPGSCYLFHCGPPHDFKCKFTSHANYSSAVLTNINYRSTAQLEEQIRRTQQEHELKSLRKMAPLEPAPLEYSYTEAPPIPVTELPKTSVITTPLPIKTGCSRNQYECRTSGDCIAIYNVCDGIPQCTDGSDEASELGCPTERPTIPSSPVIHVPLMPQTPEVLKYPPIIPHHKSYPPMYGNDPENPSKLWQLPVPPRQVIPQQTNMQYPGPQGMLSLPLNYGSQGYISGWDYRQMYEPNKEAYNAANQVHPKNELTPYEQEQPHIFKHKSSGVVSQSVPEANSYIDTNRPYAPYYPPQSHGAWQEGQPQTVSHPPETSPSLPPKIQHNRPPATQEQLKTTAGPLPCKPSSKQVDETPKEKNVEKKEHETEKTIHANNLKNADHSTKSTVHESLQETKKEPKVEKTQDREVQHKKTAEDHQSELRIHHYVAEHLQQNNHRTNVDILRPKGAVISLALGLTATAIMAALIACRLRVVRRRGRRGHGPYAHDADYLVNGMYL